MDSFSSHHHLNIKGVSGDDFDIALAKEEAAGGKIIMPKISIGRNGFMGHFIDTEGNRVAFHSMS